MTRRDAADRHLVVVDTETTGLRPWPVDYAVEVAWWDLATDERGTFVPAHDVDHVLAHAEPRALEINGYRDRLAHVPQDDGTELRRLHAALDGHIIAGSNVRRDVEMLAPLFDGALVEREPWYYHLGELGPYAAGVLGMTLLDPPGLAWCCEILGVEPGGHRAADDVTATGLVFRALIARAEVAA